MKTIARRPGRLLILVLASVLLLGACDGGVRVSVDNGGGGDTEVDAAGFVEGLLDGFIAPFTGIASLFQDDVTVYEDNREGPYTMGFILGLILIIALLASLFTGGRRYYVARR